MIIEHMLSVIYRGDDVISHLAIDQIKKVKLRRNNDAKLLREVNALSRMSHSSIVRYYTVR